MLIILLANNNAERAEMNIVLSKQRPATCGCFESEAPNIVNKLIVQQSELILTLYHINGRSFGAIHATDNSLTTKRLNMNLLLQLGV